MAELQTIFDSGDLTQLNLGGTDPENKVVTAPPTDGKKYVMKDGLWVPSGVELADVAALSIKSDNTHAFQETETGVQFPGTPDLIQGIERVDTAYGPNTGLRYLQDTTSVQATLNFFMLESGSQTQCMVALRRSTFADKDVIGSYTDDLFLIFQSSSSNEGTLQINPAKPYVPADTIVVMVTQKGSASPSITFESTNVFGRSIPAVSIELVGIKAD